MSLFYVRIELHHDEADYDQLHDEMKKREFVRTIKADDGRILGLPSAMYSTETNLNRDDVFKLACEAAEAVHNDYWTLVIESGGAIFRLDEAKK